MKTGPGRNLKSAMAAGYSETGAQLLTRLGAKPSLEALEPRLFPHPHTLRPGEAAELYGPSGCGKTETLLHLIANCILSEAWRGAELRGLGVGVILVDTDVQFSMLRLFQVLERRIVDAVDRMKEPKGASSPNPTTDSNAGNMQSGSDACEKCKKLNDGINVNGAADHQEPRLCDAHHLTKRTGKRTRTGEIILCNGDESDKSRTRKQIDTCSSNVKADGTPFEEPTADQIEVFIKSCLNRFYLVRAGASSDQLVITMHSLETLIANRPDVSVLMVENIAAFYWIDRMSGGVASAQEANQRRAVGVIKRLISDYQLALVATKPALIQRNRRSNFGNKDDPTTPTMRSNSSHSDYEHHEFMCSAWNKLITHRFVMRRHEHVVHAQNQISTKSYYTTIRTIPTPDLHCRFTITNRGVEYQ